MNSTSFGSRLVRVAARSPGRSSTGPEVWRRLTPISRAMMCASVVFPRPGGPNSRTWSSASLRFLAASRKIESCPRIFSWPTYSASDLGRSDRSKASSWGETGAAEIRRSVSMAISAILPSVASCLRQGSQRLPDALGNGKPLGQVLHRELRFLVAVAESEERGRDVARRGPGPVDRHPAQRFRAELALQLEQEALGGFLADAGDSHQASRFLRGDRRDELRHAHSGEYRERDAGPDARDFQQLAERAPLRISAEAIEQMRIFAHDQMREQGHVLPGHGQVVEGAHRHLDFVADSGRLDQDLGRIFFEEHARQPADHTSLPRFTRKPRVESLPRRPPWAWQIAQASASAASEEGTPASLRSRVTMCCTCSLVAWPLPTTACFTWSAVYSETGSPASTAAQIAVPRA